MELKFKSVPPDTAERIRQAFIEDLDRWTTRVLDAKTLDEVVGDREPLPGRGSNRRRAKRWR